MPVRRNTEGAPAHAGASARDAMACFHPVKRYQRAEGGRLVSDPDTPNITRVVVTPCGHCIGCQTARMGDWAMRCMHEAKMQGPENCSFLTLTYDQMPDGGSLQPEDVTKFFKRFRDYLKREAKKAGTTAPGIRYFYCGEYGEKLRRPHYHVCLFGYAFFQDRKYWKKSRTGEKLYKSALLDKLWTHGMCVIGAVTYESASYVAGYTAKKMTGLDAIGHYRYIDGDGVINSITPEYARMSRRPGIGTGFFKRYLSGSGHGQFVHDYVIRNGRKAPMPKAYDRMMKKDDPELLERVKASRVARSEAEARRQPGEQSPERQEVKEYCLHDKINHRR